MLSLKRSCTVGVNLLLSQHCGAGQITKGVKLGHVAAPAGGVTAAQKDAYLEDQAEKKLSKTKGGFVEKLDEKSLKIFNDVCSAALCFD